MTKTVFAHTPSGADFPPFVNLYRGEGGAYRLTVRSSGNDGRDLGAIELSPENVEALATAALADLYREPSLTSGMSFGDAITALKAGKKVARGGWNGKGMWLVLVPGQPSVTLRAGTPYAAALPGTEQCEILPHIDMWTVNADGRRAMLPGWLASQTDMLSNDWQIVA